jgi:CheY-like chemotaxis protein
MPILDNEPVRILFVDDEAMLLQSCSRLLRQLRRPELVDTASGGLGAIEKLSEAAGRGTAYSAVISDLIMPGMDGAELLGEVQRLWPDTVRVLLSGQSDLIARSNVPAAQMRFGKPSDLLRILDWIQYPVRLGGQLTPAVRRHAQEICEEYSIDRLRGEFGHLEEGQFLSLNWVWDEMEKTVGRREDRRLALRLCLSTALELGLETAQCVGTCLGSAIVAHSPAVADALDVAASWPIEDPDGALSAWLSDLAGTWFGPEDSKAASAYLLAIWGLPAHLLDRLCPDKLND